MPRIAQNGIDVNLIHYIGALHFIVRYHRQSDVGTI
jgi:hypothetical protein